MNTIITTFAIDALNDLQVGATYISTAFLYGKNAKRFSLKQVNNLVKVRENT